MSSRRSLTWVQVLLDELPMIYAAMQALYCITAQGGPTTLTLKLGCAFVPVFVTVTYLLFPDPVYHQAAYGVITFCTAWKQYTLGKTLPRQSSLYKDAVYLLKSGLVLDFTAFAIWNLDNLFCDGITAWRARVPVSRYSSLSNCLLKGPHSTGWEYSAKVMPGGTYLSAWGQIGPRRH